MDYASNSKYEGNGKSGVSSDNTRSGSGDSGRGTGRSSSSSASKKEETVADEREEGEVEEKADEIDEDELYLRLWALRSMIPAADLANVEKGSKKSGDDEKEKVDDMMKLIQEADDAAETEVEIISITGHEVEAEDHQLEGRASLEEEDCDIERYRLDTTASFIQTSGPVAVFPAEEGKDRPMYLNSIVQKLRNSMQKLRENERRHLVEQQEQYSPSQSPLYEAFSPINSDSAAPSPPESGDEFEAISSAEEISWSKGMDVSASPISPLPDHEPQHDGQADTRLTTKSSLPVATSALDMTTDVERGCNLDSVPMDITSENEAEIGEIEFFRNQRALNEELFPTSVWGFKEVSRGSRSDAYWEAVTTGERTKNSKTSQGAGRSRKRKRRRRSTRAKEEATQAGAKTAKKPRCDEPEVVLIEDESDDEDALRATLLLDMQKKRTETAGKNVAGTGDSNSSAAASPVPPQKTASPVSMTTTSTSTMPPSSSNEPFTSEPPAHTLMPSTSTNVIKKNAASKPSVILPSTVPKRRPCATISTKKPSESLLKSQVQKTRKPEIPTVPGSVDSVPKVLDKKRRKRDFKKTATDGKRVELSQTMRKKYFPNLFSKIVIPLERSTDDMGLPGSIEELLREARRDAERKEKKRIKKRTPPPKPIRKFPPNSKYSLKTPKVTFNAASLFSAAQKRSIIAFSDIQHLPLDQQQEYRRLQQIIKMKEASKKKALKSSDKENKVESEEEMRKRLIQGMEDKRKSKVMKAVEQADSSRGTVSTIQDLSGGSSRIVASRKESVAKREGETAKLDSQSKTMVGKKSILNTSKKLSSAPSKLKKLSPTLLKKTSSATVIKAPQPSGKKPSPAAKEKLSSASVKKPSGVKTASERAVVTNSKSNNEIRKKVSLSAAKEGKLKASDEGSSLLEPEVHGSLQVLEASLVGKRKDLTSVLFKMSAQISTLKGERDQLQKARDLEADLRRKLADTMELVTRKEDRIADLNRVVRESLGQVNEQRRVVKLCEAECVTRGREFMGREYSLPVDHSATIAKKLESIRSNAELLQGSPARSVSTAPSIPPPPPVISKTSTNSSALAHLKSSNHHVLVDPHIEFCRYELQGKCNDDSCPFQHQRKRV